MTPQEYVSPTGQPISDADLARIEQEIQRSRMTVRTAYAIATELGRASIDVRALQSAIRGGDIETVRVELRTATDVLLLALREQLPGNLDVTPETQYVDAVVDALAVDLRAATDLVASADVDVEFALSMIGRSRSEVEIALSRWLETHSFCSTQINLPEPLRSDVLTFPLNEDDIVEREDNPHVTVRYGLTDVSAADVARVLSGVGPVRVVLGLVSVFEAESQARAAEVSASEWPSAHDPLCASVRPYDEGDGLLRCNCGMRWRVLAEQFEFTDRYQSLGIPYPDPKTVCQGQCEGTGWVPVYLSIGDSDRSVYPEDETDPQLIDAWHDAEDENPTDDGWHFVRCPTCNGTGLRGLLRRMLSAGNGLTEDKIRRVLGGPGSGNFGHGGRPGEVGGSSEEHADLTNSLQDFAKDSQGTLNERVVVLHRDSGDILADYQQSLVLDASGPMSNWSHVPTADSGFSNADMFVPGAATPTYHPNNAILHFHTHPVDQSFSDGDWRVFSRSTINEMRVVTPTKEFRLEKTSAFSKLPWQERTPAKIQEAWTKFEDKAFDDLYPKHGSKDDFVDRVIHETSSLMADHFKVKFTEKAARSAEVRQLQSENDVVKIDVDSKDLHTLNALLATLPHTDTHPTYQPHVTIAYVKPGRGAYYADISTFAGQEFLVDHLVFTDRDENQTVISLMPTVLGGKGSGNFGHAGRKGEVGGSSSDGGFDPKDKDTWYRPGGEWQRSAEGDLPYGWIHHVSEGYEPPTVTHEVLRGGLPVGLWGHSHAGSQAITGESAKMMNIPGYKDLNASKDAQTVAAAMLHAIEKDKTGAEEPLYHAFENVRGTEFRSGDTLSLPLTATSGEPHPLYGIRSEKESQEGAPTVFRFEKGTPMVGYSTARKDRRESIVKETYKDRGYIWDEAIVAGKFRVSQVETKYMGSQHSNYPESLTTPIHQVYGQVVHLEHVR